MNDRAFLHIVLSTWKSLKSSEACCLSSLPLLSFIAEFFINCHGFCMFHYCLLSCLLLFSSLFPFKFIYFVESFVLKCCSSLIGEFPLIFIWFPKPVFIYCNIGIIAHLFIWDFLHSNCANLCKNYIRYWALSLLMVFLHPKKHDVNMCIPWEIKVRILFIPCLIPLILSLY